MIGFECPYCGTTHAAKNAVISTVRCHGCGSMFTPPVRDQSLFEPDLRALAAELDTSPPSPPPPRTSPLTRPKVKPKKELHGYRSMFIENSRKFTAIVIGMALATAGYLFFFWFDDTSKSLDRTLKKTVTGQKAKINSTYDAKTASRSNPATRKPDMLQPKSGAISGLVNEPSPAKSAPPVAAGPTYPGFSTYNAPATAGPQNPYNLPYGPPTAQGTAPAQRPNRSSTRKHADTEEERRAAGKLSQAKRLGKEGKSKSAAKLYREIIDKYPDTDAAESAREVIGDGADR